MVIESLRRVSIFAGLSDEDLEEIAAGVSRVELPAGDVLFEEGDAGSLAYVIEQGEVEVLKITSGREVLVAVRSAGDVIGEMALLDAAPRSATVRARADSSLLAIPKALLDNLLETSPASTRRLFKVLLDRWRETESRLRQSQRMAQLGTLTAGLAHELNNPAAAVRRAASQLGEAVDGLGEALSAAARSGLDMSELADLLVADETPSLTALERSDREAELEESLTRLEVAKPWELVSDLVEKGVTAEKVDSVASDRGSEAAQAAVLAVAAGLRTDSLLAEVGEGVSRLSAIVGALKSYSYLDQAPLQEVDVRKGLEDTVLILKHKLSGIEVITEFAEDTPLIEAYAPELNQVWTNLLDNAADALAEDGTDSQRLVVRTRAWERGGVVVEVEDNGPGIPEDLQPRIFDPFFTTKPPGSGTGLGLDISYGIVVHKHRGEIGVESAPGKTVFRVALPPSPGPRSS